MVSGGFGVVAAVSVFVIVLTVTLIRLMFHATTVLKLSAAERRLRIELLRIQADTEVGGADPAA
jgi:hypothetical protein